LDQAWYTSYAAYHLLRAKTTNAVYAYRDDGGGHTCIRVSGDTSFNVVKDCSATVDNFFCYKPGITLSMNLSTAKITCLYFPIVRCPMGSLSTDNGTSCIFAHHNTYPNSDYTANGTQEYCSDFFGGQLPSLETKEEAVEYRGKVNSMLQALIKSPVDLSKYAVPLSLAAYKYSPEGNWGHGSAQFQPWTSYNILMEAAKASKSVFMNVPNFGDISASVKSEDEHVMRYCQQNAADYYCIDRSDYPVAASPPPQLSKPHVSSHGCISYCKAIKMRFAVVWLEDTETKCLCHHDGSVNHDALARTSVKRMCKRKCGAQLCGVEGQSVVVYDVDRFPVPFANCDEIVMKTNWASGTEIQLNMIQDETTEVECLAPYGGQTICQSPLIATTSSPVVISTPPIHLDQWFSAVDSLPSKVDVKITFSESVKVRYLYTSWSVESFESAHSATEIPAQMLDSLGIPWTFAGTGNSTPATVALPFPVTGRVFMATLVPSSSEQFVPLFEMRGCQLPPDAIFPPANKTSDKFVFVVHRGTVYHASEENQVTDYDHAVSFCASVGNGGRLAVLDTTEKNAAGKEVALKHETYFRAWGKKYLIGTRSEHMLAISSVEHNADFLQVYADTRRLKFGHILITEQWERTTSFMTCERNIFECDLSICVG
jgi:hypothetical protein